MKLRRILVLSLFLVSVAYSDEPRVVSTSRLFDNNPVQRIEPPNPFAILQKESNPFGHLERSSYGLPVWAPYPDAPSVGPGTYPGGLFKLNFMGRINLTDNDGKNMFELPRIPHANRYLRRDDTYQVGLPLIGGTEFHDGMVWGDRIVYPFSLKGSNKPSGAFIVDPKTGKIHWMATDLPEHEEERYLITPRQSLTMKLLNDSIRAEEVLKAIEAGEDINRPLQDGLRVLKRRKKETTPMPVSWDVQDGVMALEQFPVEGTRAHSLPNFCFHAKGMTPLASALVSCRADLVTLLLEKGAARDAKIDFTSHDCKGFTASQSETIGLQKLMDLREEAAKEHYFNVKRRNGLEAGAEVKERWVSCNEANKAFASYVKSKTGSFTVVEETDGREGVILRSKKQRGAASASADPMAAHKGSAALPDGDPTPRPRYAEEEQAELARVAKRAAELEAQKEAKAAAEAAAKAAKAAAEETSGREDGFLKRKKKN